MDHLNYREPIGMHRRINGGILDCYNLRTLKDRKVIFYPLSLVVHNTKPVGHQVHNLLHFTKSKYFFFKKKCVLALVGYCVNFCFLFAHAGSCWFAHLNIASGRF